MIPPASVGVSFRNDADAVSWVPWQEVLQSSESRSIAPLLGRQATEAAVKQPVRDPTLAPVEIER
jgi:hypothetical protein